MVAGPGPRFSRTPTRAQAASVNQVVTSVGFGAERSTGYPVRRSTRWSMFALPGGPDAPAMRRAMLTTIGVQLLIAASAKSVRSDLSIAISRTTSDRIQRWRAHGERGQILRF